MNLLGWPALSVVERLAPDYPDEVERWLLDMYDRHVKKVIGLERSKKAVRAHRLALVAFHADRPMLGIVLQALKDFRSSWDVVVLGVSAVRKTPPPDGMVAAFADVLLSESCWKAWPHSESVVKSVVDGLNDSNAIERIELLCQKIQATSDTASQSLFEQHRRGSVLDIIGDPPYRDRLFVLVKGLTEAISRATEWVATSDLLNVLEGKSFPPGLASRLRAWMLSKCSDTEHDQMIGEIEEAIRSGRPTRDHLALVDRVVAQCHPSLYTARWGEALGPAPDVGEVERVLAEDGFPAEEWFRVWRWASLLPGDAVGDWSPVGEALESKWGRTDRAWYEYRPTKARSVTSPIPAEQLKAVHPWEAARQIAEWRAQPDEWPWTHIGPAKLGLTLEAVVKENPEQWTADPLQIARLLRHPTYVKHYLRAVADVTSVTMPISGLLDVISHVRTHPGEVIVLGEKKSGYDPDWTRAEAEAVELIQALARIDVDFSDRKEEIWAFLETQTAKCRPENSTRDTQLDAYERAINRPCTRALDAVIHLIANEYRRSGTVSPAAVPIFETGLRLPGNNGKEHRAILASQIGFIRHVLPEWTENNLDLFFRDHAPEGLGQRTFEMVIKWGQPHWMLKRYRPMLKQAVTNEVPRALDFLLVAMLRRTPGYSPRENLGFLQQVPENVSKAGASLALLLQQGDTDQRHLDIAQEFWQEALKGGNLPLEGFGRFADVTAMDAELWADLTLQTLKANGRIDSSINVADKLATMTPTATTLTIFHVLIQGRFDPWQRSEIAERAKGHLLEARAVETTDEYRRLRTALQERDLLDN